MSQSVTQVYTVTLNYPYIDSNTIPRYLLTYYLPHSLTHLLTYLLTYSLTYLEEEDVGPQVTRKGVLVRVRVRVRVPNPNQP